MCRFIAHPTWEQFDLKSFVLEALLLRSPAPCEAACWQADQRHGATAQQE
jgi:hypothetical protein